MVHGLTFIDFIDDFADDVLDLPEIDKTQELTGTGRYNFLSLHHFISNYDSVLIIGNNPSLSMQC